MTREAGSRERMVATTARLLRSQGYHGTGLNQIVAESRAPKGSLYHYFPGGKEELAAEALRQGGRENLAALSETLGTLPSVADGLAAFLRGAARVLEESDFEMGCPLATAALEACGVSQPIQKACSCSFSGLEQALAGRLQVEGVPPEKAADLATLLLASFEGALILCKAHRTTAPLRSLERTLPRLLSDLP